MRKHTVASGFSGIRNLEFFGLSPTGAVGHMRDAITIGRVHFIDMSTSRDCTTIKGSSPTVLNIRISGNWLEASDLVKSKSPPPSMTSSKSPPAANARAPSLYSPNIGIF